MELLGTRLDVSCVRKKKRWLSALSWAAGAALLTGGLVGFALAGPMERPRGLPAEFGVPGAFVGDRGNYSVSAVRWEGSSPGPAVDEVPLFSFEWLPPGEFWDAEGKLRWANRLEITYPPVDGCDRCNGTGTRAVRYYDVEDRLPFRFKGVSFVEDARTVNTVQLGPLRALESTSSYSGEFAFTALSPSGGMNETLVGAEFCGLRSALQGAKISLDRPVRVFPRCTLHRNESEAGGHPAASVFRAVGIQRIGDLDTVSFASEGAGRAVYAWFNDRLPYPVQLAWRSADEDSLFHVARLSRFSPGDSPLDEVSRVPASSEADGYYRAPELRWAPREPWGPSEDGFEHPFPLSAAYRWAKDDAQGPLDKFLDEHPHAYVEFGQYGEFRWNQHVERVWRFGVTDGTARLALGVGQEERFVTRWPNLGLLPATEVRYGYEDDMTYRLAIPLVGGYLPQPPDRPVAPGSVPGAMPTVASLANRWEAYASGDLQGLGMNLWAFAPRCLDDACELVEWEVVAGRTFVGITEDPVLPGVGASRLVLHASYLGDAPILAWEETRGWTFLLELAGQDDRSAAAPAPLALAAGPPLALAGAYAETARWQFPAGGFVAASGLMALVVGAAYLLWPILKQVLGVPLFSRLERSKALDHPTRARIASLVESEPGLHFQEVARRLDLGQSTAEHHLGKLVAAGALWVERRPGYTCYFPPGMVDRRLMTAVPLLKSAGARRVLAAVAARPGASALEVAAAVGLTPPTVTYHLKRLGGVGLVDARRQGSGLALFATDLGAAALGRGQAA